MVRFGNKVWMSHAESEHRHAESESESEPKRQLIVACTLWLRSLDSELGLHNLIKLLVRPCNDIILGLGTPEFPKNRLVISDGTIYEIYGLKHCMVWTDTHYAPVNMDRIKMSASAAGIKFLWVEWALACAMISLADAGINWFPKPKPKTIGGLEVADFL